MPARRRLDRETVVETAEALVDRDGWEFLTMTALASKLGVRGPSLYNHVKSVEALLDAVQTRALAALGSELQRAAMGKSGPQGLHALATALRTFAAEHPGRYELAMSEPIDRDAVRSASAAAGDALSAVVESFGVPELSRDLSFIALSTLHGVLALDRAGLFRGSVDATAMYDRAIELVVATIESEASH